MKAAQFVGVLFLARDMAHSVHLNTRSFSKHSALNEFYHNIVELADKFAEAYQGRHGLIGQVVVPSNTKTSNIVDFLTDSLSKIETERYNVVEKSDTPLQNIVDEIVGEYLSTLYKLKFLTA